MGRGREISLRQGLDDAAMPDAVLDHFDQRAPGELSRLVDDIPTTDEEVGALTIIAIRKAG